jgi:diguanylate cyclase (GGDEF)-like protein
MSTCLHPALDGLASLVIAEFSFDGALQHGNAGFLRIATPSRIAAWNLIRQPRLDALVASANPHPETPETVLYQGMITLGDPEGTLRSLTGTICRSAVGLTLVAGYDIDEMEAFSGQLLELNRELDKIQSELRRSNTELKRRGETIQELLNTDALTGLCSRRRFDEVLQSEADRARRYGTPLSLVIADIDFFKRINDCHGHEAGDQVLKAVGEHFLTLVRQTDIAARIGGEEFVILMPGIALDQALLAAERMRAAFQSMVVHGLPEISLSFGVAGLGGSESILQALARADAALYRAKAQGRNRVVSADVFAEETVKLS